MTETMRDFAQWSYTINMKRTIYKSTSEDIQILSRCELSKGQYDSHEEFINDREDYQMMAHIETK